MELSKREPRRARGSVSLYRVGNRQVCHRDPCGQGMATGNFQQKSDTNLDYAANVAERKIVSKSCADRKTGLTEAKIATRENAQAQS